MHRSQNFHQFFILALLTFALSIPALAQSDRGAIAGNIVDGSGAGVADAKITATDNTGAIYSATSRAGG